MISRRHGGMSGIACLSLPAATAKPGIKLLAMVILLVLLTIILLVLLVLGLHRYQLSVAQSNADKHDPLPPLTDVTLDPNLPDFDLDEDSPAADLPARTQARSSAANEPARDYSRPPDSPADVLSPATAPAGAVDASELTIDQLEPDQSEQATDRSWEASPSGTPTTTPEDPDTLIELPQTVPEEAEEPTESAEARGIGDPGLIEPVVTGHAATGADAENAYSAADEAPVAALPVVSESWQGHVAELKKNDSLEAALQVCVQALPLWSAYQQATLIHRARIKQLAQDGEAIDKELKALYRLAAQASFLHDRVKGLPNLPLSQLKKVDLEEVASLDMPYEEIGYNELRLIKKTDIKLLLESWGKPHSHLKPRELHADTWKNLIARRQTTLF